METTDNLMQSMENNLLCPICHDYFKQAITLNCTHSFCYNCISSWQKTRNECPVCRLKIDSMAASLALDNLVSAYTNKEKVRTQIIADGINSNKWYSNGQLSTDNSNRDPIDNEDFEFDSDQDENFNEFDSEGDDDFGDETEENNYEDYSYNSSMEEGEYENEEEEGEEEEEEEFLNSAEDFSESNSSGFSVSFSLTENSNQSFDYSDDSDYLDDEE